MDKILELSICIPTYKRADTIERTLYSLVRSRNPSIEIIVSDNSDDNETENVIQKINDNRIKYFKNDVNIGKHANIIKALERASTDYALLMADEEELECNILEDILKIIHTNKDCSVILGQIRAKHNENLIIKTPVGKYDKGDEAVQALPFMGWLFPIIVRARDIDYSQLYSFQDGLYTQLMICYQLITKGKLLVTDSFWGYVETSQGKDAVTVRHLEILSKNIESYSNQDGHYALPASRYRQLCQITKIVVSNDPYLKKETITDLFLRYLNKATIEYEVGVHTSSELRRQLQVYYHIDILLQGKRITEDYMNFLQKECSLTKEYIESIDSCYKKFEQEMQWNKDQIALFKQAASQCKRMFVYGTTFSVEKAVHRLEEDLPYHVEALVDSREDKKGMIIAGKKVIPSEELKEDDIILNVDTRYKTEFQLLSANHKFDFRYGLLFCF